MKRNFIVILVVILFASMALASLSACKPEEEDEVDPAIAHLFLDDRDYVNYAQVCDYDYVKYPDLLQQGLFWHSLNEDNLSLLEAPADSEEGASYVDTNKPTIIFVHGMEANGYERRNSYDLADGIKSSSFAGIKTELGVEELPGNKINLIYLWLKKGWNVGFFHWERFSSGPKSAIGATPMGNEERIWATDGKSGTQFIDASGKARKDGTSYCIAEHFAAEYIRAVNLLDEGMGDKEIRVAAHSMGGEVTVAGLFLLSELSHPDVGQISKKALPTRYSLLDTYFSMILETGDSTILMTVNDITISWSKKPLPKDGMKDTILGSIKYLANLGLVMDYYTYNGSALKMGLLPEDVSFLLDYMTITDVNINWQDYYEKESLGWLTMKGHVSMLYWYGTSIIANTLCKDVTDGVDSGKHAPSALMSTEELKTLAGNYYLIEGGQETFKVEDDTFTQPGLDVLIQGFSHLS